MFAQNIILHFSSDTHINAYFWGMIRTSIHHLTPAFSKHSNHYADISCTYSNYRFSVWTIFFVVVWFCFVLYLKVKWFVGTYEPTKAALSCNNNRPNTTTKTKRSNVLCKREEKKYSLLFVEPQQHLSLNGSNSFASDNNNNKNFTFLITSIYYNSVNKNVISFCQF